ATIAIGKLSEALPNEHDVGGARHALASGRPGQDDLDGRRPLPLRASHVRHADRRREEERNRLTRTRAVAVAGDDHQLLDALVREIAAEALERLRRPVLRVLPRAALL